VPDTLPLEHLLLQLRRPAAQEQGLQGLIGQLHDPNSPDHHQWLTAPEFGAQFGPAPSDIQQITNWLQSRGFRVNVTYPSGMTIDFSGTAGQVSAAFHTEIHYIQARGERHFANITDPQIPSALAPAVVGIVSLNDFKPRKALQPKPDITFSGCGSNCYDLTPADLATIYNFNPLFSAGNTGQGQSIYLIEDTDLFSTTDWTTFRTTFGLGAYGATLNTVHPAPPMGTNNCMDPGVNGDDEEAILDAEWATAAAPSAAIIMATCANTSTFGGLIAIQNLVNGSNPPAIISLSYAECEADLGSAGNAAYNSIYQQGVAEGVSIYVAAGDNDAAVCDNREHPSQLGIAVNGFASTPYNVAVGGTDFSDTFSGTNSTYWSSTNSATFGSAKSYIPEIPWNATCGSGVTASYAGFATTYGSAGLCNSTTAVNDGLLNVVGGSGGPSTIYSKPS
jgi:subtilase family serine protease